MNETYVIHYYTVDLVVVYLFFFVQRFLILDQEPSGIIKKKKGHLWDTVHT